MIFMTHPKHGAMNANSPTEATEAKKNGWVESTHEKWLGDKLKRAEAESADEPADVVEQEETPVERKKPGPKAKAKA